MGEDSQLLNAHNSFLKTQCDGLKESYQNLHFKKFFQILGEYFQIFYLLKCEVSVREAEISSLKTRLESNERTNQETKMHLEGNKDLKFFKKIIEHFSPSREFDRKNGAMRSAPG